MRWLLLLCFIALATVARAEEELLQDQEQLDLLESIHEDNRRDFARMRGDLLEFNDEDDTEHDKELEANREARAKDEESAVEQKADVEPEDQARYNKFMDNCFRKVNADAPSTIDPLDKGKKEEKKEGRRKNPKGNKNKGGNTNQKNVKNKQNKNKKKGRHPKNLNLDKDEVKGFEGVAVDEEEVHHLVTRDAELAEKIEEEDDDEEEALERQERTMDLVDDDKDLGDSDVDVSRSGKPKGNKKSKSNKKQKGKKNEMKGGKKKGGNKKKGKKNERSANKNNKCRPRTFPASLTGIATLTRIGEVSVLDRKDGKELRTEFKIGPADLKDNKKFDCGKNARLRSAIAKSPELTGKIHLFVTENGKAKITKFNISRPSVVTKGTLNKDGARLDNYNFLEKSIGRIVANAANKLTSVLQ